MRRLGNASPLMPSKACRGPQRSVSQRLDLREVKKRWSTGGHAWEEAFRGSRRGAEWPRGTLRGDVEGRHVWRLFRSQSLDLQDEGVFPAELRRQCLLQSYGYSSIMLALEEQQWFVSTREVSYSNHRRWLLKRRSG